MIDNLHFIRISLQLIIMTKYKTDDLEKKKFVETMFDEIAPKYDLFNRISTFGIDRLWRKKVVNKFVGEKINTVVDLATGTGDLAFELVKQINGKVIGLDLSENMLEIAKQKRTQYGLSNQTVDFIKGDAEKLPFPDNYADGVTMAFGLRNMSNIKNVLSEIHRILKPNSKMIILEFIKQKRSILGRIIFWYLKKIIPIIGGLLSKKYAFEYLPQSILEFMDHKELKSVLNELNYKQITFKQINFGICTLIIAEK